MRTLIVVGALVAAVGGSAGAQAPTPAPQAGRAPGAEMLLARTGELQLTDAQVVRLAAIARRTEARRNAMRASRDSARSRLMQGGRPDSAARVQMAQRLRAEMDRMREQDHADRRDAIAVLTADQQARAWEMVSRRGMGQRGMGQRGMGQRGMAGRPGMRGSQMRGQEMRMRQMQPRRPMDR